MTGPNQFYRYAITGNGQFLIERHEGEGAWTRLSDDWQDAAVLQTGLNMTNRLAVQAAGGQLTFYINGEEVAQVAEGQLIQGKVALAAGTFSQSGLQVAFDNVAIKRPG